MTPQWVRKSAARGVCLNEDDFVVGLLARTTKKKRSGNASAPRGGNYKRAKRATPSPVDMTVSASSIEADEKAALKVKLEHMHKYVSTPSFVPALIYLGCTFHLVGFADDALAWRMGDLLRCSGGIVLERFSDLVTHVVGAGPTIADSSTTDWVRSVRADYPGVAVVHSAWAFDCFDRASYLDAESDAYVWTEKAKRAHRLAGKENRSSTGSFGAKGSQRADVQSAGEYAVKKGDRISMTGFTDKRERYFIARLIQALGATFENAMPQNAACLIRKEGIDASSSAKLRHAEEWGIPVRDGAWLRCMARKGDRNRRLTIHNNELYLS